ncbi:MAG: MFS transporter [Proteobacteria bacterium]|nr:MAG: MFS transporter [Pseudomonadota bacterium]
MDAPRRLEIAKDFLGRSLAGACATFTGVGLGRFAYVPLFPAMVLAGWVEAAGAGLLGAANLAGYLAGALGGRSVARRLGVARALDLGMAATALSFAACAVNGGLAWFTTWRLLAGVSGGILMALAGPAVQETTAPDHRGLSGGLVISGVGSGIVTASLLMPALIARSLPAAWLALAVLVVLAWLFAHPRWPQAAPPERMPLARPTEIRLLLTYGLAGAGMVPHMVYLGDFAMRALGFGSSIASLVVLLFGLGAISGTLVGGHSVDRLGADAALRLWLALQVVALAFAVFPHIVSLSISSFLGGFFGIGITGVVIGWTRELTGANAGLVWSQATAAFALAQATMGLVFAFVFARSHSHVALFALGLSFSVLAFGIAMIWSDKART